MKWLIWITLIISAIDIFLVQKAIDYGVDVFAPGISVLVVLGITAYTVIATHFLKKADFFELRPITANLILLPSYLFLVFNLICLTFWIANSLI